MHSIYLSYLFILTLKLLESVEKRTRKTQIYYFAKGVDFSGSH